MMNVPFLDLKSQYQHLKEEIDAAVQAVFRDAAFILGPQVEEFEKAFAAFIETRYSVGVANGTDALRLSYEALGIGQGDEVIMPAHTFVATAIGAMEVGARPVLVDADPKTFLIDYDQLEKAITPRSKAICPVHLYGRACDMDRIMSFAEAHQLRVVEDTAQAHGARWKGKRVGSFGDIGSFSFYPGKNLGAYGDAGGVVMNHEHLYRQIRKLRNYGSEVKYQHPEKGMNSRLDSAQAAVLKVKLARLETWNTKRWQAASKYNSLLSKHASDRLILPDIRSADEHVFHLYVIQVPDRASVMQNLSARGVATVIHYPNPYHLQGGYAALGYKQGDFPQTERLAERILSLPMFPEITDEQIEYVCESLIASLS
jgi:dTDP-4-amino-4,6-dideoxygalactose transaminase